MTYERVMLPTVQGGTIPMDIYVPTVSLEIDPDIKRPTVVVYPGGGYSFTSEREGEPLALRLAAHGFNACVVWYRVKPSTFPDCYQDAASAVGYIRTHAEKYHVDENRIAIMGFSAGGHLAASVSTMWQDEFLVAPLGYKAEDVKPNAAVLGYPVVSHLYDNDLHVINECYVNLTGSSNTADYDAFDLEKRVTALTPATFIWSTWDDEIVPIQNSLVYADALQKAGVTAELHIFPHGHHGASLSDCTTDRDEASMVPDVRCWIDMAMRFLKNNM